MLGNDTVGNCVFCTAFHWIQQASLFIEQPLPTDPTTKECVDAYSAVTGYTPADPGTDNGTVVMGPGGLVEYWTRHGLLCGGVINMLTSAVDQHPRPARDTGCAGHRSTDGRSQSVAGQRGR